jgi:putative FmdB family regulatory protein
MPTYVYECSSCEQTFEVEQRITEDPLKECRCGASGTVKRVIQPIAVMFKGSGFHVNDYSSSSNPAAAAPVPCESASPDSPACESCPNKPD